jgi:uncharacterized protein with PQ loop repeat
MTNVLNKVLHLWLPWSILSFMTTTAQHPDLGYAGISAWYNSCERGTDSCFGADKQALNPPLYFDFDTCYSNPNLLGRSLSFFSWNASDDTSLLYNIMFTENGMSQYSPTDCDSRGSCACESPTTLKELRDLLIQDPSKCDDSQTEYDCVVAEFVASNETCWVPFQWQTLEAGLALICAMVGDQIYSELEANYSLPPSLSPSILHSEGTVDIQNTNADELENSTIDIPDSTDTAYCTAIVGWYDSCNLQSTCDGANLTVIDPLFLDFDHCFSNPKVSFMGKTVSFFGKDSSGKVKEFHLLFQNETNDFTESLRCGSDGACECTEKLQSLKSQFLINGTCENTDVYKCMAREFVQVKENKCYIPLSGAAGDIFHHKDFICAMAASLKQFESCSQSYPSQSPTIGNNTTYYSTENPSSFISMAPVTEIPVSHGPVDDYSIDLSPMEKAAEMNFMAITGWWNGCKLKQGSGNGYNECVGATNVRLQDPIYLNLDTAYINPNIEHHSITFYLKNDKEDQVYSYNLLFNSSQSWNSFLPVCNEHGECAIDSSTDLAQYRDNLYPTGECSDHIGFVCRREIFLSSPSECYVPALEAFDNSPLVCSMVATLQSLPPVESQSNETTKANSLQQSNNDGMPVWIIVMIAIVIFLIFSILVSLYRRCHQSEDTMTSHDEEEEVWVRKRAHSSRFTRRALNTDETADGTWNKSNIHDLKFQMMT